MKGRPVDQLVYEQLFRTPKPGDCQNFNALLQRQLVPEVRLETAAFYGNLDTKEAQYPGLDYSHPPHRMRLGRFPWHRRLFRAFDTLGLTKSEIASLTKWEGTRWAKERFEKEQGITIEDTTGKEIEDWVDPKYRGKKRRGQESEMEMEDVEEEEEDEDEDGEEESDLETESVGIQLNARLRARVAERLESNLDSGSMDEQWEQWMKEITEAGDLDLDLVQSVISAAGTDSGSSSTRHSTTVPSASPTPPPAQEGHREAFSVTQPLRELAARRELEHAHARDTDFQLHFTASRTPVEDSTAVAAPRRTQHTQTARAPAPTSVPSSTRQPDGHRTTTTRTPIQTFALTNPFALTSSLPASRRLSMMNQSSNATVPVVSSRHLPWNRSQPRQAQPPRS